MKQLQISNIDQIVSVKAIDKRKLKGVTYKPRKKRFFWGYTKPGYKLEYHSDIWTKEEIERYYGGKLLEIDNILYRYPYSEITFSDQSVLIEAFDTMEEAEKAIEEISANIPNKLISKIK